MAVSVQVADGEHHLVGDWAGISLGNKFLAHLRTRAFSPATVRAYAYDVANLARFLEEQRIPLTAVGPMDIFAWVDWQGARRPALRIWSSAASAGAGSISRGEAVRVCNAVKAFMLDPG